jgi:hypothetical protein
VIGRRPDVVNATSALAADQSPPKAESSFVPGEPGAAFYLE